MVKKLKSVILYNELSANPGPDEADVLDQVKLIAEMLDHLGISHQAVEFSLNLQKNKEILEKYNPDFVFNLVESVNNCGNLIFLAPALLNSMNIPFTGGSLETIFLTSSKTLCKQRMKDAGIPTAYWYDGKGDFIPDKQKQYIIKPIWEDGSLGLDEDSVFSGADPKFLDKVEKLDFNVFFIEEYIEGREFNISMLAANSKPQVLPIPEMLFHNYAIGKPRVLGYTAKWNEDSFEYTNTTRTFDLPESDRPLLDSMTQICYDCWDVFRVNGYSRVDFRVDEDGNPWVLELNVNPCITPGSGFYSACERTGIHFSDAVIRILRDIPNFKLE
ncbi:MAG: ATP-grasp domain-containing protein [Bacteroidales bacterium]